MTRLWKLFLRFLAWLGTRLTAAACCLHTPELPAKMAATEVNLDQVYAFTVHLAKEAGKRILEGSAKRTSQAASVDNPNTKKNRVDRESYARTHVRTPSPCMQGPLSLSLRRGRPPHHRTSSESVSSLVHTGA